MPSAVNTLQGGALFALYPQLAEHNDKEDTTMNKLISIIVAGAFAGASISAIAQAPKAATPATPAPAATAPAATPAKAEAPKAEAKADAKAAKGEAKAAKAEVKADAKAAKKDGDKKEAPKK